MMLIKLKPLKINLLTFISLVQEIKMQKAWFEKIKK